MSRPPPIATNREMRDFYESCCQNGLGDMPAMLDRRGLEHLKLSQHLHIGLGFAPEEESTGGGASYVRAVF